MMSSKAMPIRVKRSLTIETPFLHTEELDALRRELTYENPVYERRLKAGNPLGDLKPTFTTMVGNCGSYEIARGAMRKVEKVLGADRCRWVIEAERVPVRWPSYKGQLRPYQERAAQVAVASIQGIVVGGCGSGKTEILLAAAHRAGQRTLIVVDSVDLQRQWRDRYLQRFDTDGSDLTLIGGDGSSSGPLGDVITIATAQSIRNRQDALDAVGTIIADEVHLWAARTFQDVVARCPAFYRLGATATLQRTDGLVPVIVDTFGDVVYTVSDEELSDAGVRQPVQVRLVKTPFTFDMKPTFCRYRRRPVPPAWNKVLDSMTKCKDRHDITLRICLQAAREGLTLVLSSRREYALFLGHLMAGNGYRVASLLGGQSGRARDCLACGYFPKDESGKEKDCPSCGTPFLKRGLHNEQALAMLREGKLDAVVATSVADKGLDVPALERAVVVLPTAGGRGTKLSARFTQQLGRLARVVPGKVAPVLYYMSDERLGYGRDRAQAIKRGLDEGTVSWFTPSSDII